MNESDSLIWLLPSAEFLLWASFEASLPFLKSVISQKKTSVGLDTSYLDLILLTFKYNKVLSWKMCASMMKPVFLLWLCSFGNKLWSFCEASPWVYVKRILNELLPCLAFCTNSVNILRSANKQLLILEHGTTVQSWKH